MYFAMYIFCPLKSIRYVESDVEGDSVSNDEDYEKSESESEEEIAFEEDSETESEPEAVEEPKRKKSKVDPLFKWPKISSKRTMPKSFDDEIRQLSINENELPPDVIQLVVIQVQVNFTNCLLLMN